MTWKQGGSACSGKPKTVDDVVRQAGRATPDPKLHEHCRRIEKTAQQRVPSAQEVADAGGGLLGYFRAWRTKNP